MIKYSFNINGLHSHSEYSGVNDVIYAIYWSITATTHYGKQSKSADYFTDLPLDISTPFIDRINISDDILVSWIEQYTDINLLTTIKDQLIEIINTENIEIRNDIQYKIDNNISFDGYSLIGADLSDINLSGLDLSNTIFNKINFFNTNLSNVNFTNANLRDSIFHNANLTGAILDNVNLTYVVGNNKEIVTWYTRKIKNSDSYLEVNFTKDILYFGCFGSSISNWKRFKDNLLIEQTGAEDLATWRLSEQDHYDAIDHFFTTPNYILPTSFPWDNGIVWYPQDGNNYIWDADLKQWKLY